MEKSGVRPDLSVNWRYQAWVLKKGCSDEGVGGM
jgi:hypothetical protein